MVDAGQFLGDAGAAATSDAAADEPRVMEVACSAEATAVTAWVSDPGVPPSQTASITWTYAEVVGIELQAVRGVDVLLCDRDSNVPVPADACRRGPAGTTLQTQVGNTLISCEGVRERAQPLDCVPGTFSIQQGLLRVPCGYAYRRTGVGGLFEQTDRYRTARITIR